MVAEEIERFEAGGRLLNVINPQVLGAMSEPVTLAIDAGTGSCRAVIFDLGGTQLGARAARMDAPRAARTCPAPRCSTPSGNWR